MSEDKDSIASSVVSSGPSSVASRITELNNFLKDKDAKLLAVSKYVEASRVGQAIKAGQKLFGENYVQEAKKKKEELLELGFSDFEFHFIGGLQSNKAKDAVGLFSLIHSVDRLSLAKAISKEAVKKSITQDILIQVNISNESTKSGVAYDDFDRLLNSCLELESIRLRGLMTIGSYGLGEQKAQEFEKMKTLYDKYENSFIEKKELSMGMSADYELAIRSGATIVRLGTSIFGTRRS